MDKKAEKLKDIIKGKVQSRPTFGTDPNDPWSVKAGITEENVDENAVLNKYLISKGLNPKTASKVSKISASKTGEFERWKQRRVRGGRLPEETNLEEGNALLNAYLKSRGINPDHVDTRQKIAYTKGNQFQAWLRSHVSGGKLNLTSAKYREGGLPEETIKEEHDAESLAKKHGVSVDSIEKQLKMGQEIEHEHTKDDAKALKIAKDHVAEMPDYYTNLKKMEKGKCNEEDCKCSKGAKLIKDLYKKKIEEDLNDWEKEDKSIKTYGKKPNHDKADPKDSAGEKKPSAAAVLSGGKTLTGEPRDTIEIDPMMRVRPGQPDPTKDKKKDDKKQDIKKDK